MMTLCKILVRKWLAVLTVLGKAEQETTKKQQIRKAVRLCPLG